MQTLQVTEERKVFDTIVMKKYRYLKEIHKNSVFSNSTPQQESSKFTIPDNLIWELKLNRDAVGKWGNSESVLSLSLESGDVSNTEVHVQCFGVSKIFGLEGSLSPLMDVKFDAEDSSDKLVTFQTTRLTAILLNVVIIKKNKFAGVPKGQSKLLTDLELLSNNKRLHDVTLIVDEKEFKVHKAILAARSPVFLSMFKPDMLEKVEDRREIKDVDSSVFSKLLEFVYTGKVYNVTENVADLYVLAEKYSMEDLKRICNNVICNDLRIENAIGILILSDLEKSIDLKMIAMNFVIGHLEEIIDTEGYRKMVKLHPHLLDEIFRAIAAKRKNQLQTNQIDGSKPFENVP